MQKDLISSIRQYIDQVVNFQKQGVFVADFSKGYYLSAKYETNKLEKLFLLEVPRCRSVIIKELNKNISNNQKSHLLHLLGWSKEYKKVPNLLLLYVDDRNTSVSNAAMRSLFPMVASGKFKIPIRQVIPLIYRRSPYVKNKSLGLLAFIKDKNQLNELKKELDIEYIKKLAKHKKQMISVPANMLLNSLNIE